MKQKFYYQLLTALIAIFFCFSNLFAVDLIGELNEAWELTWTDVEEYDVIGDIWVTSGNTLTVNPGAIVNFNSGYGLEIRGGAIMDVNGTSSDYALLQGSSTGAGHWDGIYFDSGSDGTIEYLELRDAGSSYYGIFLEADGSDAATLTISDSYIHIITGVGISGSNQSTTTNPQAEVFATSCHVTDCSCYGINIHNFDPDCYADNCTIENCEDYGLAMVGTYNANGGLRNNLVVLSDRWAKGIQIGFNATSAAEVYNNMIIGCNDYDTGMTLEDGTNIGNILNNISYNCDSGFEGSGGTIDYNLAYGYTGTNSFTGFTTVGGNCLTSDPLFVGGGDYHVTYDSPVINTGSTTPGTDPGGSPCDMGIYGGPDSWLPFYAVYDGVSPIEYDLPLLFETYRVENYIYVDDDFEVTIAANALCSLTSILELHLRTARSLQTVRLGIKSQ